ncbi:protein kinase [Nonomuraea sp. NPDC050786]|uniref:protein kinase domain-containing protein n=1 Tax=Nonomuraea sp. NPDC050786 TaxID=3154840 RepID=UPI00340F7806
MQRRLRTPEGRYVPISSQQLGLGAEGIVFALEDTLALCAKIYTRRPADAAHRINSLALLPPATWDGHGRDHLPVAWPRRALLDEAGELRGFLMPRITAVELEELFEPRGRVMSLDEPTWKTLVAVAARLAETVARLHAAGIVIGDVSPKNVMVNRSGQVTLIDCDTVQFTDAGTRRRFPNTKRTDDYAPPEILNGPPGELTPAQDAFGLAVVICTLLMEGDHPFEGRAVRLGPDQDASIVQNILMQDNRISHPERLRETGDEYPVRLLPLGVLELALRCFGPGHYDPDERPTASEWQSALYTAGHDLMGCRVNERHFYCGDLDACPWCELAERRGDDLYPMPVTGARPRASEPRSRPSRPAADRPAAPRRRQTPPRQAPPRQAPPRGPGPAPQPAPAPNATPPPYYPPPAPPSIPVAGPQPAANQPPTSQYVNAPANQPGTGGSGGSGWVLFLLVLVIIVIIIAIL